MLSLLHPMSRIGESANGSGRTGKAIVGDMRLREWIPRRRQREGQAPMEQHGAVSIFGALKDDEPPYAEVACWPRSTYVLLGMRLAFESQSTTIRHRQNSGHVANPTFSGRSHSLQETLRGSINFTVPDAILLPWKCLLISYPTCQTAE